LSVFQSLAAGAFGNVFSALPHADSAHVAIVVQPPGTYWFVEETFVRELRAHGMTPVPSSGDLRIECAVKDAHVKYSNVRREGLLGSRVVDRTTVLSLWLRVSSTKEGAFVVDTVWHGEHADTVSVDLVDRLESPAVSATHASLPSEGFFSSWLEPLILVGSIGVAVLLLFTVRS
jgi:hypothetical protein